MQSPKRHA